MPEMKTISEQIIEELLSRLQQSEYYDETAIAKLKEAAASGKLTSPKVVIDAIGIAEEQGS